MALAVDIGDLLQIPVNVVAIVRIRLKLVDVLN